MMSTFFCILGVISLKKKRIKVTRFFSRSASELIREESQVILFYFLSGLFWHFNAVYFTFHDLLGQGS